MMDRWNGLLGQRSHVTLATATTGLGDDDQLIAAAVGDGESVRLLVRMVPTDQLEKAAEYHGISAQFMMDNAMADGAFVEALSQAVGDGDVWTYNPHFHQSFVERLAPDRGWRFENLPMLYKAAESRFVPMARTIDELYAEAGRAAGRVPSWAKAAQLWNLGVPTGPMLPVEAACWRLERLRSALARSLSGA